MADLQRKVVAFLEGRRTAELADLIQRHNGLPLAAPCLRELHRPDAPSLQAEVAGVLDADLAVAIFLTGVGTTTVFEAARQMGREADLRHKLDQAIVTVRGPKPTAVLRKLEVRIDLTAPPPNTTAEVLGVLEPLDLSGKTVSVQLYGEPNPTLSQALRARGAEVLELAPYVWDRPVDPAPILTLLDALEQETVDALLITSQAQVDNLFRVARDYQRTPRLHTVAIGAQGPVAEAALNRYGIQAAFKPAHGHMGALVLAAAEYLAQKTVILSEVERSATQAPRTKENGSFVVPPQDDKRSGAKCHPEHVEGSATHAPRTRENGSFVVPPQDDKRSGAKCHPELVEGSATHAPRTKENGSFVVPPQDDKRSVAKCHPELVEGSATHAPRTKENGSFDF